MLITNKERMSQLTSSIDSIASVLLASSSVNNDAKVSPISDKTVGDMLNQIKHICSLVANADPKYFADLDLGYTDDSFPVKH